MNVGEVLHVTGFEAELDLQHMEMIGGQQRRGM